MPYCQMTYLKKEWHFPSGEGDGKTKCGLDAKKWERIGTDGKRVMKDECCDKCWRKSNEK